jgi:hypothetical protein
MSGEENKIQKEWGINMWMRREKKEKNKVEKWVYFNPCPHDKHLSAGHVCR